MRGPLALVVIVGCGFNPAAPTDGASGGDTGAGGDAGKRDAAARTDAGSGSGNPGCFAKWTAGTIHFNTAINLGSMVNTGTDESHPWLSSDELSLYFARGNNSSLFHAGRSSTTLSFSNTMPFAPQPTGGGVNVTSLSMSADALTLVEAGTFGANGGSDWLATRAQPTDAFGPLTPDPAAQLNMDYSPFDPFLVGTGLVLYFAPVESVGAKQSLKMATRADFASPFVEAAIPGYTAPTDGSLDGDPWVDASQQLLLFGRVPNASSEERIMFALYNAGTQQFGTPAEVPIDGSDAADEDPWLSPDYCRLYLAHKASDGADLNLAMATAQ